MASVLLRSSSSLLRRGYATSGSAKTLVLVEHNGTTIDASTLSTLQAAKTLGGSIVALVAGGNPAAVAAQVQKVPGVTKVLVAKDEAYAHGLPENLAALLEAVQKTNNFTHILATHSAFGNARRFATCAVTSSFPFFFFFSNRQERPPAPLGQARRRPGLGRDRHRRRQHVCAPHLRRQRHCHRQEQRRRQARHHPRHLV